MLTRRHLGYFCDLPQVWGKWTTQKWGKKKFDFFFYRESPVQIWAIEIPLLKSSSSRVTKEVPLSSLSWMNIWWDDQRELQKWFRKTIPKSNFIVGEETEDNKPPPNRIRKINLRTVVWCNISLTKFKAFLIWHKDWPDTSSQHKKIFAAKNPLKMEN